MFICINKNQIYTTLIVSFFIISIACFSIYTYTSIPCSTLPNLELQNSIDTIYTSDKKVAYLTFDDGPTKVATNKILDILKEQDVKATFFVVGYRIEEFPEIIKREYEEGHCIANHTYSHKNNQIYKNKESFISEILNTDKAIAKAIGIEEYHSGIFRFPNGSNSRPYTSQKKKCKEYLKELNYVYIDWNALNNDSVKKYSSYELVQNLKKSIKGKGSLIILMHDTVDVSLSYTALEESILYLKNQGYIFKTFSPVGDISF